MDSQHRRQHWERVYTDKDPEAVSWYTATPEASLAQIRAAGIGRDAAVIDVGAGASTLVDHLLRDGFTDLTILDVSEAALNHARRRLAGAAGRVAWIAADVLAWAPERAFDLWHDRAVFHFLTEPGDRRAYVANLSRAVAPGGQVVLATFAPDGPERCSGLPVQRHDPASLARELGANWHLVDSRRDDHVTPGGAVQRFVTARFRRTA